MVMAWAQLYAELLYCGGDGAATGWLDDNSTSLLLFVATCVVGFLLFEGIGTLCSGAFACGRIFAGQKVCWASVLATSAMFLVMLLNLLGRRPCLICVVPVCALVRLLLVPLIDESGKAFARATALLRKRSLDLEEVLRALDSLASLGQPERRTLGDVAREVDRQVVASSGTDKRVWDEANFKSFLRGVDAALTGPRHGHPWSVVEACLSELLDQLGSAPSSPASPDHYGIFTSLLSGLRQLAHGGMQELAVFCSAAVLDGCLGPLQAWLISLLTKAAMEGDRDAALVEIAAYMGSYALGTTAYCALVYSYSALLAKGTASIQRRVAAKMLAMGSKEHAAYPSGSVNAMFASDVTRLQDLWTGVTWSLLSPLMKVLIAVLYAVYASPQVGILALTVFPLIFVTVPQCHSSSVAAAHSAANSETISMFQNGVSCQPVIWSCDKQSEWLRRYLEPKITDQRRKHMKMRLWGGIVQAYVQQLVSLFVAVHVAILAWLAATGGISVAEFTGFVSLFSSLGTPSISLGGFYRVAVACAGSAQRVDEFLQEGPSVAGATLVAREAAEDDPEAPCCPAARWHETGMEEAPGDLVVDKVSYRYPGLTKPTIEDVSFAVQPGDFASIVGGSGCGKSTLLSLLMTWLQPASGCVSIGPGLTLGPGGQDRQGTAAAAAAVARRLRDRVAVVFQDTMMLSGTVHENIAISAEGEVTRADVEWAAAAAGCADFITSHLPDGYDTVLGAEGASLSGGQAQRICIARALCRKPSVLLLDEATSALDPGTAGQILKTIAGLNVNYPSVFGSLIVVSITHHPHSLMYSNLVVHMDAGHVERVEKRPQHCDPGRLDRWRPSFAEAALQRHEPDPEAQPCNASVSGGAAVQDESPPDGTFCLAVKKLGKEGSARPGWDHNAPANAFRVADAACLQAGPSPTTALIGG